MQWNLTSFSLTREVINPLKMWLFFPFNFNHDDHFDIIIRSIPKWNSNINEIEDIFHSLMNKILMINCPRLRTWWYLLSITLILVIPYKFMLLTDLLLWILGNYTLNNKYIHTFVLNSYMAYIHRHIIHTCIC